MTGLLRARLYPAMSPTSRVSRRIAAIQESATLAIDAKAKALKAAGEPVIGFGAGEPDFATPAHIVEAAVKAAQDPANHRYTPAGGLPELKDAIVCKTKRDSGYVVTAAQVLVTNGGKQAVYNTFAALCDPGDEVLVQSPYWVTYPEAIVLAGGVPVYVESTIDTGFKVTVADLEAKRTDKTKILLFVSPSNPTGAVYSPEEVAAIGQWAAAHGLWVVTDEIYEHLLYGDRTISSIATLVPELSDRVVIVHGVAKTYAMTGWRVGWMLGPIDVIKGATNLQSHATSNVNNIAQRAAIAALSGDLVAVGEMRTAFDRRRQTMQRMLSEVPGFRCLEPEGAFYAYPSVEGAIGKTVRGTLIDSSLTLANVILEHAKVAIVPGEAFGSPGYARLSYALGDADLAEGVGRINALLRE
jgi:aspartate aminotransferase